jgi:hypothetical protein
MPDDLFPKFLAALRPHSFCVSCLGRMYDQPAHAIREWLQPLITQLASQIGECRGCNETTRTYRVA